MGIRVEILSFTIAPLSLQNPSLTRWISIMSLQNRSHERMGRVLERLNRVLEAQKLTR